MSSGLRVFLIGFMGAGKSVCGRELAHLLGIPFVDLDEYVELRAGLSITELFARHGERHFRALELEVLDGLLSLPYFVMATGGGTPCHNDTIERLRRAGTTVFLDVPVDDLVVRLRSGAAHRPLLAGQADLRDGIDRRLTERRECYERAHLHLHLDNRTPDPARLVYDSLLNYHSF